LEFFRRAANHANPFPMALHAMGNHYRFAPEDAPDYDLKKALYYYRRAA